MSAFPTTVRIPSYLVLTSRTESDHRPITTAEAPFITTLGGLLGKVKKEKKDDAPKPEIDELEQYLAAPLGTRHRGGRARVVEGEGEQVAGARKDGEAVLRCARLLRRR